MLKALAGVVLRHPGSSVPTQGLRQRGLDLCYPGAHRSLNPFTPHFLAPSKQICCHALLMQTSPFTSFSYLVFQMQ